MVDYNMNYYNEINEIIKKYLKNNNLEKNNIVEYVYKNNYDNNKKYYFGTIINLNNNLKYIKIFLQSLFVNTNFESIVFCFITDLDYDIKNILKKINFNFSYILVKINNKSNNPYYLNYYIGNELLKKNVNFLNILHNDYLIDSNYFELAKTIIKKLNLNTNLLSLYNGLNLNNIILKTLKIENIVIDVKSNLNYNSLFYNKDTFENVIKYCLNNTINNPVNPINQISKFLRKMNYNINIFHKSKLNLLTDIINNNEFKNDLLKEISKLKDIEKDNKKLKDIEKDNKKLKDIEKDNKKLKDIEKDNKKLKDIEKNNKKQKENKNNNEKQKENKNNNEKQKEKQKIIYQKIEGDFVNQLSLLFNLISLSNEYNLKMMPYWDENYSKNYKKDNNIDRKSSFKYNMLKNVKFYDKLDNDFIKYQEKELKYNKIVLNKNTNYNISGYFQSYKYFWNNIKLIKNILNIDYKLINKIKKYYASFDKDIIAIHIRQGDYLNKQDYHPVQSLEYYKKALSYFDLEKHTILLFSDDYKNSCKFLEPLNLNYVDARDFSNDDETQFYMLMLCKKKICTNSSFSLMSCYLNEMFLFCENAEYIFPNKWFGIKGPEFNMDDLMLNYKFSTIDCNNLCNKKKYDVVSILYKNNINTYKKYFKYNKKHLNSINKLYYISDKNNYIYGSNFINIKLYPFSELDIINYLEKYVPINVSKLYYLKLLKLYIFKINSINHDNVLICDYDTLLLKNIKFFDKNNKYIFYSKKCKSYIQYKETNNYILPELNIYTSNSGIYPLMIFNKKILDKFFDKIEKYHKKELWKVCLDSIINYIKNFEYKDNIFSEFELYYHFVKLYYKDDYIINDNFSYEYISYNEYEKKYMNNQNFNLSLVVNNNFINQEISCKKLDNIELIDLHNNKKNENYLNNLNDDYIISLAVLPRRLLHADFEKNILSLIKQTLKPKRIIINYCEKYKRIMDYNKNDFLDKIKYLKNKYSILYFNKINDYGPASKILGLFYLKDIKINENSKIIILDDDFEYNLNLVYNYALVYELYNCDYIAIDEKKLINWSNPVTINIDSSIFYDNYQSFIYGWLSFSIKFKHINNLNDFYHKCIKINDKIFYHDDLLMTLYVKKYKLYGAGINLFFTIFGKRELELIDGLRVMNEEKEWMNRANLEIYFLNYFNINYKKKELVLDDCKYIVKNIEENNKYNFNFYTNNSEKNNLLINCKNINYDLDENDYKNIHWDIKFFDYNIFILTLTKYNDNISVNSFTFYLNNNKIKLKFNNLNKNLNKQTFFIYINGKIDKYNYTNKHKNIKIIQTYECNNISRNRFYSICSLRNYLPEYDYIFFNENDRINFIKKNYSNFLETYQKVNVGAYKADLFRIMYLYKFGGLYFDCKNILYCPLDDLLNNNEEIFLKDVHPTKCANGIILIKNKSNKKLKDYMINILYNFHTSNYSRNCLAVSGPHLMSEFISGNYLQNNINKNDWQNSYVTNEKNIVIKISYNYYYNENDYINKKHYSAMYNKKQVYKSITLDYSKINGISGIAWINMNRSEERRTNMVNILKNIKVPNYRIEAIDGKKIDKRILKNIHYVRKMTDGEIGCTLSHIKAIQYLSSLKGDYFMIAEDDICFKNLNLTDDINTIIKNSPVFDTLLLSKIYPHEFNDLYTDWNVFLKNKEQVAGTGCYIISRQGINKILNICQYKNDIFHFKEKTNFDVADIFIYQNTKSYIYKYNIVSLNTSYSSNIHEKDNTIHENWHKKCEINQDKIIINNLLG